MDQLSIEAIVENRFNALVNANMEKIIDDKIKTALETSLKNLNTRMSQTITVSSRADSTAQKISRELYNA